MPLFHRFRRALPLAAHTYAAVDCNQRAAAVSYRVLFSLVPFFGLLVFLLELVLPDTTQEHAVSWLIGSVQLPDGVEENVEDAVAVGPPESIAGLVSLVLLHWSASGMMGAVRYAFRAVWGADFDRPYVREKLLDAALVVAAGVLVVSAFGLTVVAQAVTRLGGELARELGRDNPGRALGVVTELVASATLTFAAFVLLYRAVPPTRVRLADSVVGAVVGTIGVLIGSAGFSLYLAHFADFDDVYGPLGTVLAFLLLVFVLARVLLFGAAVAAAWPLTVLPAAETAPSLPVRVRLRRGCAGCSFGNAGRQTSLTAKRSVQI